MVLTYSQGFPEKAQVCQVLQQSTVLITEKMPQGKENVLSALRAFCLRKFNAMANTGTNMDLKDVQTCPSTKATQIASLLLAPQ